MDKERFKELRHEASLWCDANIPDQWDEEVGHGVAWQDKFAELIVKECLLKVNGAKIRGETIDELIERIKDDFGVE